MRQYHSMGDVLDRMMAYGHDPVEDSAQVVSEGPGLENGHAWLTEEPAM